MKQTFIVTIEAEIDQAVENRDYWKEQAIILKAKAKELIDKACEWLLSQNLISRCIVDDMAS